MPKSRTIELNNSSIGEFPDAENPTSSFNFNVPLSFDLCGIRDLEGYRQIALEDVRIKTTTVFRIIKCFASEMQERQCSKQRVNLLADFLILLSQIGEGLTQTSELIEMDFDSYKKSQKAEVKR